MMTAATPMIGRRISSVPVVVSSSRIEFRTFLIYLGLAVITLSLAAIVVWLIIFAFYNTLANYEENLLEERFGNEYLEYKKKVRKWIPV